MWRRKQQDKWGDFAVWILCILILLISTLTSRMYTVEAATTLCDLRKGSDTEVGVIQSMISDKDREEVVESKRDRELDKVVESESNNELEEIIQSVYTSTESVLGKSYKELIASLDGDTFEDYISTLKEDISYVIPGMEQTNVRNKKTCNVMVPQGICVAGDFLIISAYDKCEEVVRDTSYACHARQKSVLYVMDAESQEYLTTITLNTACHVGALAYNPDDNLIYVADSEKAVVQKLSLDKIVTRVESGNDTEKEIMEFDGAIHTQGYIPSFLTYYRERLYVGQFAKINLQELFSNRMAVFTSDGTLLNKETITLPYFAQGVAFADWKGECYMLVSTSFGRKRTAALYVYLMGREQDGSLWRKQKVGELCYPNMSEDIDIQGDCIYSCYESASSYYRMALDGKGKSTNMIDRIMVGSLGETLMKVLKCDDENPVKNGEASAYTQMPVSDDVRKRLPNGKIATLLQAEVSGDVERRTKTLLLLGMS